ncbi:o-succinylbenzoate--CoA ligase [Mangrovibacillus cuniculi]|uniref:2-succinylbenzoate--CoA ligase n=2 Tax=Mangrovibacillus cuniculi TaxID=2593652 RepID=A0A7S8HG93_9BACI|nr:o-succinylbenzoate--CoA ligase [Mangrovibacillus cuniculi]
MMHLPRGDSLSFKEVDKKTEQVAKVLNGAGIKEGDRVSVHLSNKPETVIILLALQAVKAIAHCVNTRLSPEEIIYQVKDCSAALFISDSLELMNEVRSITKTLEVGHIFNSENHIFMSDNDQRSFEWDDTCSIMYTSGTTGKPKGVIQSYGNHYHSATASSIHLSIINQDCWYCAVPIFHVSGFSIIVRSLVTGCSFYLAETYNQEELCTLIQQEQVTIASVVTVMLLRFHEQWNLTTIPTTFKGFLVGGGPVPKWLLQELTEKGFNLFQTYGMTETCSQVVTLSPEKAATKIGSVGLPLLHTDIKIDKLDGSGVGEILVKGPTVTKGYWGLPEVTSNAFVNGWFKTGDIGYLDQDEFLYIKDRRSDLIISGGENIYPAEIESVLLAHPNVEQVAVIGVQSTEWGQSPSACIVLSDHVLDIRSVELDLIHLCHEKLASYKHPVHFHFMESLPMTSSMKIKRHELKALLESEQS